MSRFSHLISILLFCYSIPSSQNNSFDCEVQTPQMNLSASIIVEAIGCSIVFIWFFLIQTTIPSVVRTYAKCNFAADTAERAHARLDETGQFISINAFAHQTQHFGIYSFFPFIVGAISVPNEIKTNYFRTSDKYVST